MGRIGRGDGRHGFASPRPLRSGGKSRTPVIFFDGVCGLCNRFVDFVLRRDPNGLFLFLPCRGKRPPERLNPADIADLKTVVVVDGIGRTASRTPSCAS